MNESSMKLTSLLRVEERLLEADFFVRLMRRSREREGFGYCLNAFVSAARSVTFLIQKEMSKVPGFAVWWNAQQESLGKDRAARFFLKMRNYSQKEGRISIAGTRIGHGHRERWSYRFAGNVEMVPQELLLRDVTDCCTEHVIKLARLTLACAEKFPYHACPRRLVTPEGLQTLGLSLSAIGTLLGFPPEWIAADSTIPFEHQLRILREQIDGLDFDALKRLTHRRTKKVVTGLEADRNLGEEVLTSLVTQLEEDRSGVDVFGLAATMILRGMKEKGDPES